MVCPDSLQHFEAQRVGTDMRRHLRHHNRIKWSTICNINGGIMQMRHQLSSLSDLYASQKWILLFRPLLSAVSQMLIMPVADTLMNYPKTYSRRSNRCHSSCCQKNSIYNGDGSQEWSSLRQSVVSCAVNGLTHTNTQVEYKYMHWICNNHLCMIFHKLKNKTLPCENSRKTGPPVFQNSLCKYYIKQCFPLVWEMGTKGN